jgi:site-specific DNA-methyltransferase (adenine-specific)
MALLDYKVLIYKFMINKGLFTSNTPEWPTPKFFFTELNKEFNFTLDPCATKENAKCKKFFTKEDDGLAQSWDDEIVFCNPPYGRQIKDWVRKANLARGGVVVLLIPARTDTSYFHDYIYNQSEIRFIRGRLKFGDGKNPAPFPSMLAIFKNNYEKQKENKTQDQ